jgi:hypothetical protein
MKLLEFIEKHNIDGFQIIPTKTVDGIEIKGKIINVMLQDKSYGIKINTSNIKSGITLENIMEYTLTGNILSVGDLTLDIEEVYMVNSKF